MFIYMGMVEQRINEILQAFAYVKAEKHEPLFNAVESRDNSARGGEKIEQM